MQVLRNMSHVLPSISVTLPRGLSPRETRSRHGRGPAHLRRVCSRVYIQQDDTTEQSMSPQRTLTSHGGLFFDTLWGADKLEKQGRSNRIVQF